MIESYILQGLNSLMASLKGGNGNSIFHAKATAAIHASGPCPSMPSWQRFMQIQQLSQLEALPHGWDGDDAEQIAEGAVRGGKSFVMAFTGPASAIIPSASGTVVLEWDSPLGEAVLEIGQTRFSFYISPNHGNPIFRKGSTDALSLSAPDMADLIEGQLFPSIRGSSAMSKPTYGQNQDERIAA